MLLLLFPLFTYFATPQTVTITVSSSANKEAPIRLAVYASADDFATEDNPVASKVQQGGLSPVDMELQLPNDGDYVFAAYHDLNGNGKLDRNFLGVPTEPYGFPRTPPSKWRAPNFTEVCTKVDAGSTASIELKTWGEY